MSQLRFIIICSISVFLVGCASGPQARKDDPLEPWNRQVFKFNDALDEAVLKPVATAYVKVTPQPVRKGVSNFFGNIKDAWSIVNNTLQLKGQNAADSLSRFGINTFLGLGGLFDIASELGIERHTKDFGHTLGYWGVPSGPYLVLPLLGPSSLRDTAAMPVDVAGNLITHVPNNGARNTLIVTGIVDTRARLLGASAMLDEIALDKYSFTRDTYLQYRRNAIYDGNPPEVDDYDGMDTNDQTPFNSEKVEP